jgi:hypothetical protein
VLLDTMYELPSLENVSKVVVDESVIEHKSEPYLIYQTPPPRPRPPRRMTPAGRRRRLRPSCRRDGRSAPCPRRRRKALRP